MKSILILGVSLLNGCALTGMYGPAAQARGYQALERARQQFAQARDDFAQAGNDLAQMGATYAQGYQQYQPAQPPPVTPPESHIQTGWVNGQPFNSYTTGNVNNGGQITNGWIGNQPYHTYSTPGLTTGWVGNQPVTIIGN